jgi:GrpB-like predicted nucleotidyltransferase (UPF0157 family)
VRLPVTIVDYDPLWPTLYEEEKERILSAVGDKVVLIEHIGSTAVVGLGAKPIIDIMAAVSRLADAKRWIGPLESIGYEYVPKTDLPERLFFRRGVRGAGTHHLHVVEQGSKFWKSHLLFRDFLRAHPTEARRYYQLKKELAARFGSDRGAYTDAKTLFIESVTDKALSGKASD